MTVRFRLAVVDDHPLVRRGIMESLSDEPAFDVVGEGTDAGQALEIARVLSPHLIYLDVNMPGGGGILAATQIQMHAPQVITAMFSFRQDLAIVRASLSAGARGYIVKGVSGSEFVAITHRILSGETVIDAEVGRRLAIDDELHSQSG